MPNYSAYISLGLSAVPKHLEYEDIIVSDRGIFEMQHGRIGAKVFRPDIDSVHLAYASTANRPLLEAAIGIPLFACGVYGLISWLVGRMAVSDILFILLVVGVVGVGMLYDVFRRRYVLVVMSRGVIHKLAFSRYALLEDIDCFRQQVQAQYEIIIESDLSRQ
ncbi:MAG TPA: hypothetical protein VF345_08905 [Chthoniobacterales bacterium]